MSLYSDAQTTAPGQRPKPHTPMERLRFWLQSASVALDSEAPIVARQALAHAMKALAEVEE